MNPLADLQPLIDEMARQGLLDAWLVRHHAPEVDAHVEGAVSRLVSSVARKLGADGRAVIQSEAESVDSLVASQLVETAHEVISSDPVEALLDQINGRLRGFPRAVTNDVHDAGRKRGAKKRKPRETVSFEDGYEVQAVENDAPEPEAPIPPEWLAAVALMHKRGQRLTLKNLAATLGVSDRHLRRIRAAQK